MGTWEGKQELAEGGVKEADVGGVYESAANRSKHLWGLNR